MASTTRTSPVAQDVADNDDIDDGIDLGREGGEERGYWVATPEEGRAMFDAAARKQMGISGDEFIRRWDAGDYAEIADKEGYRHIMFLAGLMSFGRQDG